MIKYVKRMGEERKLKKVLKFDMANMWMGNTWEDKMESWDRDIEEQRHR